MKLKWEIQNYYLISVYLVFVFELVSLISYSQKSWGKAMETYVFISLITCYRCPVINNNFDLRTCTYN